jgi:hypothetical protein
MSDERRLIFCAGGPAEVLGPAPDGVLIARCTTCSYTFPTLVDTPTLPAHRTSDDWVTFGDHMAKRSDRR